MASNRFEVLQSMVEQNPADAFTVPLNLAGLPGISVPCGFLEEGGKSLPVGLQLIGKPHDEATLIRVAHAYEQSTEWHKRRP